MPAPGEAAEEIRNFTVEIEVAADGDLLVTELIEVEAEGREIRQEPNGYKPPLDLAVASNVTWTPKRQARMGGESNMTNDGGYGLAFTPGA